MTGCTIRKTVENDSLINGESEYLTAGHEDNITNNSEITKDDQQIHIKIKNIPKIDYESMNPLEFLDILKQYPDSIYTIILFVPDGWIKYEHVKELAKQVESEEPCARVVSGLSSYLPQKQSTVGNEAMFLMEGFLKGKYPPSLHSENFTDREPEWYKTEWENYWKNKIKENEQKNARNEEEFLHNFRAMKSEPENVELTDKVLQSFKDVNWFLLSLLAPDDTFIVMEWFGQSSLGGDKKYLKAFLENHDYLYSDVAESYYGWLIKILEEKPEVFVKGLNTLDNECDIDEILFYFRYGLNERKTCEKKLMELLENSDLSKNEKYVSNKLLEAISNPLILVEPNQPIIRRGKETVRVVKVKNEDINGDGIAENIEYTVIAKPYVGVQDVVLKINDTEIALWVNSPSSDFNIVDINQKDKYKEIEIYEDGPSDDPKSTFFIYNGKEIIKIGELYTYGYYLDGKSKILGNFDGITFFKPTINVGWTEMNEEHEFIYRQVDKNDIINKQYEIAFSRDSTGSKPWVVFETLESNPYGDDYIAEVNKGDKVTIIDVERQGSRNIAFKVRLKNGVEGWMIHLLGGD